MTLPRMTPEEAWRDRFELTDNFDTIIRFYLGPDAHPKVEAYQTALVLLSFFEAGMDVDRLCDLTGLSWYFVCTRKALFVENGIWFHDENGRPSMRCDWWDTEDPVMRVEFMMDVCVGDGFVTKRWPPEGGEPVYALTKEGRAEAGVKAYSTRLATSLQWHANGRRQKGRPMTSQGTIDHALQAYDETGSVRAAASRLKDAGVVVSTRSISRWARERDQSRRGAQHA